jgi:hypothetical protein
MLTRGECEHAGTSVPRGRMDARVKPAHDE